MKPSPRSLSASAASASSAIDVAVLGPREHAELVAAHPVSVAAALDGLAQARGSGG